jgi:VIT1/CCC1 family predicted Fe2+/Mn2+ transporter
VAEIIPYAQQIKNEEEEHEHKLLDLLQEERLRYASSVVLGLNDALVELTGALAGLTFALQDTALMALAGLVTGISASLSMAASEYLSSREEAEEGKSAAKSSFYTGTAYIITVLLLVLPYLLMENVYSALAVMLAIALVIIFVFNYYISVAKDLNFRRRFGEMALLSMGVALLSFGIGWLLRQFIGI